MTAVCSAAGGLIAIALSTIEQSFDNTNNIALGRHNDLAY